MAALDTFDQVTERMPEEAAKAFALYFLTDSRGGQRSLVKTAELSGIPGGTVRSWASRYEWSDRARAIDIEDGRASLTAAIVAAAALRPKIVETLSQIAFDDPSASRSDRMQAIKQLREMGGLSGPILDRALMVEMEADSPILRAVSDDQLAAMLAEGDTAGLLALLRDSPN